MKWGQRGRLLQQLRSVSQLPGTYMQECASPQRTPHAMPVNFPGGFYTVRLSDTHVQWLLAPLPAGTRAQMFVGTWSCTGTAFETCSDGACLDMQAHTGSPVASPPFQRALACVSTATEAGQLHAPRVEGEAVTFPSNTNFVILVFWLTASHPWPVVCRRGMIFWFLWKGQEEVQKIASVFTTGEGDRFSGICRSGQEALGVWFKVHTACGQARLCC